MIRISEITDNIGSERKVYTGLRVGDKLKAKCKVYSKGDIGMSGLTYRYEAFIPNKIYKVYKTYNWNFTDVAYVSDEDGTLHFATPEIFDLVEKQCG